MLCGVIRVIPRDFVLGVYLVHKRIGDAEVLRGKIILARDIRQKRLQKCRDILQVRPRAGGFSHESTVQKKRELCE